MKRTSFYLKALMTLAMLTAAPASAGLTFSFTDATDIQTTAPQAYAGLLKAGQVWSSLLTDDVHVNILVGFAPLSTNVIASTFNSYVYMDYDLFWLGLYFDQSSTFDAQAVWSMPLSSSVPALMNLTLENGGSIVPYLDDDGSDNNSLVVATTANTKAILPRDFLEFELPEILEPDFLDAAIIFSDSLPFDYDPSDGIDAGKIDFVGTAVHEMGHALGFISGVDILDQFSPPNVTDAYSEDEFLMSPLDFFRYSEDSAALGVLDWTADKRDKYLSIDGGLTAVAAFATGNDHGDGNQASHWKFRRKNKIGIMDPAAHTGEAGLVTSADLIALDVIGWNAVPEPSALLLLGGGLAVLAGRRWAASVAARRSAN